MKEKISNLDKETKRRIKILSLSILGIIVLVSGMSYAFVRLSYTSEKVENINSCFDITMKDNGAINLNNAIPTQDTIGVNTSPYTYTITNTCDMDAYYETTVNVLSPSKTDDASKVRVALYGDGYLTPSTLSTLKTGEVTANFTNPLTNSLANYVVDEGYLPAKTTKTFKLAMWIGYDVTEFNDDFKTQILVTGIAKEAETLTNLSGGVNVLKNNTVINDTDYTKTTQDGLYYLKRNDDQDTFYFRGTNVNNNITFANKEWKIVRINKDGSIKLVLNDSIGTSTYTNIDTTLNTWYNSNIKGTDYEKYVVQDNYCNDTTLAYKRVVTNNKPKLTCTNTTKKSIGILSVDEVMLSNATYNSTTKTSYLDSSTTTYTLTPAQTNNDVFAFGGTKQISIVNKTNTLGIRPTITITKDAVLSGEGSTSNKYTITGLFSNIPEAYDDTTAPSIQTASVTQNWTNTGKQITISAFDESKGSGVSAYNITTSNTKPASNASTWVSMSNAKVTTTTKYNAGTYYVWVKDGSNNISTSKTVTVNKIDTTKPTCTLTYAKTGNGYRLQITGQDNNQLAGKPYSFDGTNYQELSTKEITSAGNYTARVKDIAGNINTCSVTIKEQVKVPILNIMTGTNGIEIVTHGINDKILQVDSKFATEYRYRGENVNNYVTFNNEMWRIIGVLPTEDTSGNVEYRIKIMRSESIGNLGWSDGVDSTTNSYNNWTTASLNTYLNNDYYNSLEKSSRYMIGTTKYYLGGYEDGNYYEIVWQKERAKDDAITGQKSYYGNNPIMQNDSNKSIALIYASDYLYSTLTDGCFDCSNWMNLSTSQDEWIITHNPSNYSSVYMIKNSNDKKIYAMDTTGYGLGIRPTLTLSSNVNIAGGNGTSSNPYTLTLK